MSRTRLLLYGVAAALLATSITVALRDQGRFRPIDQPPPPPPDERHVRLIVGGNYQGSLEPCGCSKFQTGGIVNLAATLQLERAAAPDALLLGVPSLFSGDGKLERMKNEAIVDAVEATAFDAVLVGGADLSMGDALVKRLLGGRVPLLSTTLSVPKSRAPFVKSLARKVNGLPVVVVSVPDPLSPEAARRLEPITDNPFTALEELLAPYRDSPSLVVVASGLPTSTTAQLARQFPEIDLVILTREASHAGMPVIDGTHFISIPQTARGQHLVRMDAELDPAGKVSRVLTSPVAVPTGQKHAAVQKVLDGFYARVATDPELATEVTPKCLTCAEEQAPGAKYAGAQSCNNCHLYEHSDWSTSRHAGAYLTLTNARRQYAPECLHCHTTGMGRESGFKMEHGPNSPVKDVQCEVCHGPGQAHVLTPVKTNVRRKPDVAVCKECHTPERHPTFAGHEDYYLSKIDHRRLKVQQPSAESASGADPYREKVALGRAFLGAGSFSEAAAAFAEAAELRPLDPEPKALVAFAKVQDGAPETMKKAGFAALEALIKQYPSYARGHFYYGVALENVAADGYRKLAQFQKAEELGLNDADFLFAMGEAYRQVLTLDRLEDGDKSVRYFEAARAKGYQSLSGNDVEWTVLIDGMKDYLSKTRASLHAPTEPIRRDARRP